MEPRRRTTMQDVARAAGVHQTTVSLALRNDPRLPEATRRRLQEVARELGYAPDPMLSALSFYRAGKQAAKAPVTMAFLANFRDRRELAASYPHLEFVEGAQEHAAQIGYRLEVFYLGSRGAAAAGGKIDRTLAARGIMGVIVGALTDRMAEFQLDWARFSVVLIESQQLGLSLHMISNHQARIVRAAVRRLRSLGYRRIGLAVGEREEFYLRNAFAAGYYVEVAQFADLVRIPPCLLVAANRGEIGGRLTTWARAHEVDAVVSNWHVVPDALRAKGWALPREIVVATLDLVPGVGSNAGMRQNHRIVGARAVEQLAILMKTNQRGLVHAPNHTLIEGMWLDGSDVPPRRGRAGIHSSASIKSSAV